MGVGYFNDPMQYAAVAPMPLIFGITIAVIVVGAAVALCSTLLWRRDRSTQ